MSLTSRRTRIYRPLPPHRTAPIQSTRFWSAEESVHRASFATSHVLRPPDRLVERMRVGLVKKTEQKPLWLDNIPTELVRAVAAIAH